MQVHITSSQMIKPSSYKLHLLKPFKLSLLDQLSPINYVPLILFYAKPHDSLIEGSQVSQQLKQSLEKALDQFYPLAGRTKNNLFISDYDEGVPYVETRVNGRLADFVDQNEVLEAMNQLLPYRPFCYVSNLTAPQLAIQVNVFECGGIAVAVCCSHKIFDASTISVFLNSWAAFNRGSNGEIPNPNLLHASSRFFPPVESMPPNTSIEGLLFNQGSLKTRSFVFDANAIAALVSKAKSNSLEHPSRVVSLSAFLWKHAIQAARSASRTLKPAILSQAVNIRQRLKPQLPDYSIGNLFLLPTSTYNSVENDIKLTELAYLVREGEKSVTSEFQDLLQGEEGFKVITKELGEIAETVSKGNAEFYTLSSWLNTLDGKEDFGLGKPTLFSIPGVDSHNHEFSNCFILKQAMQHNAIEAWITLSDKDMGFLEHDQEFLTFASPIRLKFDKFEDLES